MFARTLQRHRTEISHKTLAKLENDRRKFSVNFLSLCSAALHWLQPVWYLRVSADLYMNPTIPASSSGAPLPASVRDAVLLKSTNLEGCAKVGGYDFNKGLDYEALLESFAVTGFQATSFGSAVAEINRMVCHAPLLHMKLWVVCIVSTWGIQDFSFLDWYSLFVRCCELTSTYRGIGG